MMISKKVRSKLHDKIGESIGETLIALLIGALALTMLAGAVGAAFNMIKTNQRAVNEYYKKTNNLVTFTSAVALNDAVKVTGDGDSQVSAKTYKVEYVKNNSFSKTPVVSYKVVG